MIRKIFMLAVVATLASGCKPLHPTGCHKTTAWGSCSSGRWDDQDAWGAQARAIRAAINAELVDPQRWKRKQCLLHLKFARDGLLLKISTGEGNKAYCDALKVAAAKARFPAFSDPQVYHDFTHSHLYMSGEG